MARSATRSPPQQQPTPCPEGSSILGDAYEPALPSPPLFCAQSPSPFGRYGLSTPCFLSSNSRLRRLLSSSRVNRIKAFTLSLASPSSRLSTLRKMSSSYGSFRSRSPALSQG